MRTDLYHFLAEALAEPPEWLALPGAEWPLTRAAIRLASDERAGGERLRLAAEALAGVPAEGLAERRARYAALFAGPGRPRFWLYESACLGGGLLGPATFAVERQYRDAGLLPDGAELPDHASLELEFLSILASLETDSARAAERRFVARHAGRWLPSLGRQLAASGDPVYGPIGTLLAASIEPGIHKARADRSRHPSLVTRHSPPATHRASRITFHASLITSHASRSTPHALRLPFLSQPDRCTLCGFCVQACPARALAIHETREVTSLVLRAAACTGCGQCARTCEPRAMDCGFRIADCRLSPRLQEDAIRNPQSEISNQDWARLRHSPRAICPGCGAPTVSRAELDYVAAQIGHPAWLDYCLECRRDL